ncbi:thiamine-triphosphatase [Pseudophryne corroboree]|uniref:thiamine-triphosphatase n=1 Tax=Pseudophryne corroboree TaxID=495146 RepID=UPI003081800E
MNSDMSHLSGPIEVEQKFVPGPEIEDSLHALGAELLEEVTFQDSYYDSTDLRLTLCDMWLRRRGDRWELKLPPERDARNVKGSSTQYLELSNDAEIIRRVSEELGVQRPLSIEALGLNNFASFVTHRRRFQLPHVEGSSTKAVVDLDETDFGFAVGEVEVLVNRQEEVQDALKKVEEVCKQLGVPKGSPVQGKVSTFLQRNNTEHYKQLLEANII